MIAPATTAPVSWMGFVRRLGRRLRADAGIATLAGVAMVLHVVADVANPMIYRELFDTAIPKSDDQYFQLLILAVVGFFSIQAVAWFVRARALATLNANTSARLRVDMLRQLERMSLSEVTSRSVPGTITLFTKHLGVLENFVLVGGQRIIVGSGAALVSFIFLFVVEWRLALVVVLAAPLSSIGTAFATRRVQPLMEARLGDAERVQHDLHSILTTQPVVRAFNLWDFWRDRFAQGSDALRESTRRVGLATLATQASTVMGSRLVQVIVIGAGAWLAMRGFVTAGSLIGFFALMLNVIMGVELVSESASDTLQAMESLALIDELLVHDAAFVDVRPVAQAPPLSESITLEGVSFSYEPGVPVLDDVNLAIRRGESVALVGPSGSGKSTVLGVLLGFHRPQSGTLRWDGVDVGVLGMHTLRRQIGVVFQDTMLFEMSVRDNIAMGRLEATDDEVVAAARSAEIHELITTLPSGYDTVIRKGRLSGGQEQRISLARALVRRPEVLVLDEATSALDPQTEAAINATLTRIGRDRTVVSVTHRLSGIRDFDRIIVMQSGRVAEQGNHATLMALAGVYAGMHDHPEPVSVPRSHTETMPSTSH